MKCVIERSGRFVIGVVGLAAGWAMTPGVAHAEPPPVMVNVLSPGFASVGSSYRIGVYEVTNAQYAAFLNAVAVDDPYALFSATMSDSVSGGIVRVGSPGAFRYEIRPGFSDRPVVGVRWVSALRYCNWLHHGRPARAAGPGVTEDGAYAVGEDDAETFCLTPGRSPGARWFVPTQREWTKAARWDPQTEAGAGGWWVYATRSDELPAPAECGGSGEVLNVGPVTVNFARRSNWNGSTIGNLTRAGGCGAAGPWGTFDQHGNAGEWVEDVVVVSSTFRARQYFGGTFATSAGQTPPGLNLGIGLISDWPDTERHEGEWFASVQVGFRVAAVCLADHNADGSVDFFDVDAFLGDFEAGDARADADGDGFVDYLDADAFLSAFESGC